MLRWKRQDTDEIILHSQEWYTIVLVIETKHGIRWEASSQGCEYQEAGVIGELSWRRITMARNGETESSVRLLK